MYFYNVLTLPAKMTPQKILLFYFVLLSLPLHANQVADSLRLMGKYKLELAHRSNEPDNIDTRIARAQTYLLEDDTTAAYRELKNLKPQTIEQRFWLNIALANYYEEVGQNEKAHQLRKSMVVKPKTVYAAIKETALSKSTDVDKDYLATIRHLEKAIQIFSQAGYAEHYLTALALNNLAYGYGEMGLSTRSMHYANDALKLFLKNYASDFGIISNSHNNLLFYVIEYGDTKMTQNIFASYSNYMEKFLAHRDQYPEGDHRFAQVHAEALYRLSSVRYATFMKDEGAILRSLKELERFFEKAPLGWKEKNYGILSAGYELAPYGFRQMEMFEMALVLAKNIDKAEKKPYNLMKKHAAYAMIHYDAGQYLLALTHVEASIQAFPFSPTSRSLQTLMVLKGEVLAKLGRREEALSTINQIFKNNMKPGDSMENFDIQNYPELAHSLFLQVLLHTAFTYHHLYENGNNKEEDLAKARFFYLQSALIFEKHYQHGMYNPALGYLLDEIEDGLLRTARTPEEIKKDLNLLETISNAHLWQKFSSKYLQNLNLPKGELEQKNNLQLRRNSLSRTYEDEVKNQREITQIDELLSGIENRLQAVSPEYALWSKASFDLSSIQANLPANKTIIKYTIGIKHVFAHRITKNDVHLFQLGNAEEIQRLSDKFLADIKAIKKPQTQVQSALYEKLLAPLSLKREESIVFITDAFLSFLPFEVLLTDRQAVAYAFSFKNLMMESKAAQGPRQHLAGFVPNYPGMTALPHSLQELEAIREQWGKSTLFSGPSATKTAFLKSLGQYKLHHLAMHSVLDEKEYEHSHLVFANDEKLYFHEIYALNFPSDLVVLSACNTGLGQYLNGEGVMSLARALSYAGVKSSVTSLWQVPDKESAELMRLFYEKLEEGLAKDEALSQAKDEFIRLHPLKAHPYYWAGFIISGDLEPLILRKNPWYWLGLLPLLLGLSLFIIRLKSRKKR
jgi:CHAT domain-containing protein